jgi:hypothetical protein
MHNIAGAYCAPVLVLYGLNSYQIHKFVDTGERTSIDMNKMYHTRPHYFQIAQPIEKCFQLTFTEVKLLLASSLRSSRSQILNYIDLEIGSGEVRVLPG